MRILMIGWYKPQVGGGSHVIQNLAKILQKEHKLYVINMEEKDLPTGLRHWKDGEIDVFQERMFYFKRYTTLQTLFQTTKRALMLSNKVDIYHAHGPFFAGVGFIDKRKPMVLTFHGYPSLQTVANKRIKKDSPQFKFMRYVERKTAQRADAIIAVGKTIREWIIKELGADADKVFYVPNGIDPEIFKPIPTEKNPLAEKYKGFPILLFTKHFSPRYGARDLILAFKKIVEEYPDAKLIMTNEDRWMKEIMNFAKRNDVFSNVIFTGRVSVKELVELYSLSHVFVHPSINEQETFGISVIEAMACEKPVVATAVGGPKEIMEEGIRQMGKPVGILAPPKDPDALADAILKILDNPEEAREMGKRAREYVLKNYTWDIVAKKTMEVYRYAMENHKN